MALAFGGPEVAVNLAAAGNQVEAATASAFGGRSVVVWTTGVPGPRPGNTDIHARIFDPAGNPASGEIVVDASPTPDSDPDVAMDDAGGFVVTWARTMPGGDRNVLMTRFRPDLSRTPVRVVSASPAVSEYEPSIASDSRGAVVVSYRSRAPPVRTSGPGLTPPPTSLWP